MKDMRPAGRLWHLYKMGGITPAIESMFDAQNAQQMAFIRSIMKERQNNSLYDIYLNSLELVVFDLETTGFSPYNGDEIISFGAVSMKGGELIEGQSYYSVVNPKRTIPPDIVTLTGITNLMAENSPELITALRGFLEFTGHKLLIAHASGHDKHFLQSALWKTSRVQMSHRILDTMVVAKWLNPQLPSYDLDYLLHYYEIPIMRRHHALDDSIMTAQLWSKFLAQIEARDVITLGDLYAHLSHLG